MVHLGKKTPPQPNGTNIILHRPRSAVSSVIWTVSNFLPSSLVAPSFQLVKSILQSEKLVVSFPYPFTAQHQNSPSFSIRQTIANFLWLYLSSKALFVNKDFNPCSIAVIQRRPTLSTFYVHLESLSLRSPSSIDFLFPFSCTKLGKYLVLSFFCEDVSTMHLYSIILEPTFIYVLINTSTCILSQRFQNTLRKAIISPVPVFVAIFPTKTKASKLYHTLSLSFPLFFHTHHNRIQIRVCLLRSTCYLRKGLTVHSSKNSVRLFTKSTI